MCVYIYIYIYMYTYKCMSLQDVTNLGFSASTSAGMQGRVGSRHSSTLNPKP